MIFIIIGILSIPFMLMVFYFIRLFSGRKLSESTGGLIFFANFFMWLIEYQLWDYLPATQLATSMILHITAQVIFAIALGFLIARFIKFYKKWN